MLRVKPDPFDSEERDAILAWFTQHDPYWSSWLFFLFWTGMRHGEAAALRWNDIDLKRSIVSISRSRDSGEDNAPKTVGSVREIPMLPWLPIFCGDCPDVFIPTVLNSFS